MRPELLFDMLSLSERANPLLTVDAVAAFSTYTSEPTIFSTVRFFYTYFLILSCYVRTALSSVLFCSVCCPVLLCLFQAQKFPSSTLLVVQVAVPRQAARKRQVQSSRIEYYIILNYSILYYSMLSYIRIVRIWSLRKQQNLQLDTVKSWLNTIRPLTFTIPFPLLIPYCCLHMHRNIHTVTSQLTEEKLRAFQKSFDPFGKVRAITVVFS